MPWWIICSIMFYFPYLHNTHTCNSVLFIWSTVWFTCHFCKNALHCAQLFVTATVTPILILRRSGQPANFILWSQPSGSLYNLVSYSLSWLIPGMRVEWSGWAKNEQHVPPCYLVVSFRRRRRWWISAGFSHAVPLLELSSWMKHFIPSHHIRCPQKGRTIPILGVSNQERFLMYCTLMALM